MPRAPALRIGSMGVLVLLSACGASFNGAVFQKRTVDYRVARLGADWKRVDVRGNDLAFHHEAQGTIAVNATCEGYDDVPAIALANHLLFGITQRTYLTDEEVTLDGRGARHVRVDGELDGVPLRLEIYLLVREGCVFDLSYVSQPSAPASAVFERFVHGFHVIAVHR